MASIVYTDPSNQEHSVHLGPDQPVVSVGRASDCTIRSNRKSVSRHHAEFRYTNGAFEVVDLNSSNGTWLIDQEQRFEISHERLEDQDEIWCGDFIIHFLLEESGRDEATVNEPAPADGAQQPYVPGPTEGAEPLGFGAERSESYQQGSASVGMAEPSSSIYEYEEVEELDDGDLVEIDAQPMAGGGGDIERLRAEKQSIEDLASRQAFEIEEMRAKLEQATEQLEQANARGSNAEQLQANLQQAQSRLEQLEQENRQLRDELDSGGQQEQLEALGAELESERRQVGELRDELQRMEDELAGARHRLESVREHESELEREIDRRDERIEALEHDVRTLESELESASSSGSQVESLREKLDETRIELDKSNRLLGEYERRNADLKAELEAERDSAQDNEAKLAELFDARDHLERQVEELEEQLEPTQQQLEEKTSELEEAEAELGDLRAEVQGLKQRLQLERRRAQEDGGEEDGGEDAEQLAAELVEATERIAELEAERDELAEQLDDADDQADSAPQGGLDAEVLADIRQRLGALARLTDAIERTDLEPLSTVDRIRLQSAIRETAPKETLQEAIELLDE